MSDERARILFVDDDPDVLAGLNLALRRHRRKWEVRSASSGAEALEILDRERVDAVVTDIRMPGMNGSTLLRHLKDSHPEVVRVVLAGGSTQREMLDLLPQVHRWLPKPCAREELIATLTSALGGDHGRAEEVERVVGGVSSLPSPPASYLQLVQAFADPDTSFADVAGLIEVNPAVTARILQWGASPLLGGRHGESVIEVLRAVGMKAAAELVLSIEVMERFRPELEVVGCHSELLRRHGEATAALAASMAGPEGASAARIGGLLHRVGLLLLAHRQPAGLGAAVARAAVEGVPLREAEREALGVEHHEVAVRLLELWGLSDAVVGAIRDSPHAPAPEDATHLTPSAAVGEAARLAGMALAEVHPWAPAVLVDDRPAPPDWSAAWAQRALRAVPEVAERLAASSYRRVTSPV